MVSPPATLNEERVLSVGIVQHLPAVRIDPCRSRSRVIAGEQDGELAATRSFDLNGAAPPVVAVDAHAGRHRQAGGVEDRRDRTRHRPDAGFSLADVVDERCLNRSGIPRQRYRDAARYIDGMPLVGETLGPEQLGAPNIEIPVHEALVLGPGRFGANVSEEAPDEMTGPIETTGHEAACLHLTQRRTAGRYWMRSSPIWEPQVSQIP